MLIIRNYLSVFIAKFTPNIFLPEWPFPCLFQFTSKLNSSLHHLQLYSIYKLISFWPFGLAVHLGAWIYSSLHIYEHVPTIIKKNVHLLRAELTL